MTVTLLPITFAIRQTERAGQDSQPNRRFEAVVRMPSGTQPIARQRETIAEAEEDLLGALVRMETMYR